MTVYEKWKRRIEEVSRDIRHVSQMYAINKKSIEIQKLRLCSAEFLYILSCQMNYVIAVVWIAVRVDRDYAKMNRYVSRCLRMLRNDCETMSLMSKISSLRSICYEALATQNSSWSLNSMIIRAFTNSWKIRNESLRRHFSCSQTAIFCYSFRLTAMTWSCSELSWVWSLNLWIADDVIVQESFLLMMMNNDCDINESWCVRFKFVESTWNQMRRVKQIWSEIWRILRYDEREEDIVRFLMRWCNSCSTIELRIF